VPRELVNFSTRSPISSGRVVEVVVVEEGQNRERPRNVRQSRPGLPKLG